MKKIFFAFVLATMGYCSYAQPYLPLAGGTLTGALYINGSFLVFRGAGNNIFASGTTAAVIGSGSGTDQVNYIYGNNPFSVWTNNIQRFIIDGSWNVGIGTASPSQGLQVISNNTNGSFGTFSNENGQGLSINPNISNGLVMLYSDYLRNGTEPKLHLSTFANKSTQNGITVDLAGKVGIGTLTPDQMLSVKGTIHSEEVLVDMTGWGDFVFNPTYNLASLSSVKTYLDQNHHLPDMPSAQEVIKNGINVGEMVKLQTQKIEELTLYLIEKDKQLKDQENKSIQQDARIAGLEKALEKLTAADKK